MAEHSPPAGEAAPPSRRSFFAWLTYALGAVAAVVLAVPLIGFFIGPARKRSVKWITVGPVDRFPVGETLLVTFENPLQQPWDGVTANTGVYVRNLGKDSKQKDQFLVFAINCAHLGCPVSWFPQSGLFLCPCHGGVYYENGEHASGPPPRGLFQCVWEVDAREGQLKVQAPHFPTLQDTEKG
jgi:Rieske Fe-S protein